MCKHTVQAIKHIGKILVEWKGAQDCTDKKKLTEDESLDAGYVFEKSSTKHPGTQGNAADESSEHYGKGIG